MTFLYYLGDGLFVDATQGASFVFVSQAYHEMILLFFSGIIIYVTFTLRIVYAVSFSLACFFLILPHVLLFPAYPDPEYRILAWLLINILLSIALGMILNTGERQKIYLRDILNTQERERHRLSRELHDDTAQELIDVGHEIDEILEDTDRFPENARQRLITLRSTIDDILEKTRRAIQGLQPPLLEEIGITPALFWLCDNLAEETGIEIENDISLPEDKLTQELKLAVFRITQESLNNIKKHAQATRVSLHLKMVDNRLRLQISDNGVGFTPPGSGKLISGGKLGLVGLQERVGLLNGSFNLRSKPNEGTMIQVEIPLADTPS